MKVPELQPLNPMNSIPREEVSTAIRSELGTSGSGSNFIRSARREESRSKSGQIPPHPLAHFEPHTCETCQSRSNAWIESWLEWYRE